MRFRPKLSILLGAAVPMVLMACSGSATRTDLPVPSPEQPSEIAVTATDGASGAPTQAPSEPREEAFAPAVTPLSEEAASYRDDYAGFTLRYPSDWTLIPPEEDSKERAVIYSATFSSWDPAAGGREGIPQGESKLDVVVVKQAAATLAGAVEWRDSQFERDISDPQVLDEETWVLPSGLRARRLTISGGGLMVEELFTVIDGRIVLLSALGDSQIFDRIALSLAPIE